MANANIVVQETARPVVRASRAAPSKKVRFTVGTVLVNAILILLVVLTIVPFLYMMFSAFKPNTEIFGTPITFFPQNPTFENVQSLIANFPFARWAFNTVIVAVVGSLLSVLLSSLAGFAFAKYEFRYKNVLFMLMLATLLIPNQVLLVPQFEVVRTLGWFNTYEGLIIPRAVGAFGIFLMRQYTVSLPSELLDAARIDGATEFGIWWRIVLPLVRPGLAVLGILSFTGLWNDFFWPLIITTDPSMFVVNLGISSLVGPYDYQYGILLSGTLLACLPVIIIFLFFQRQFIAGFTEGAFKG
ncbi:sugar ABC transporter permease [Reticulibacter mediterranei]|uniref:Sugar ABC transporter permease n=1 Tax=Reticulibacter mediterranei TaxID=2778369 RepID=A0A8J3IIM8_9CHLR|nr:carbohydrate ABC transporter permease [Reticulibacter mediterranei]GHO92089.1 sugar ABC transporter permease [Reticulibacter mediterranei]